MCVCACVGERDELFNDMLNQVGQCHGIAAHWATQFDPFGCIRSLPHRFDALMAVHVATAHDLDRALLGQRVEANATISAARRPLSFSRRQAIIPDREDVREDLCRAWQ